MTLLVALDFASVAVFALKAQPVIVAFAPKP